MDIKNKVILITGTSKGIGKYLAEYYLNKNCIVCGCSRNKSDIKNKNYRHFQLDVADETAVSETLRQIRKEFNRLDVLINNAGIASMNHFLLTPLKTIIDIYKTNVTGSFLFSRESVKLMKKNKTGRIINMSTVAVRLNIEGESVYASSKAALNSFTKILAKEISPYNITVNAVGLAPMKTDLIKNVPDEKIEKLLNQMTVKRLMEFEDITNMTDFLINDNSSFITGQVIYMGGV